MDKNFTAFKQKRDKIYEWLAKEFSTLRTGRATPSLLDNVMVDSYGSKMPIKHVAAISTEDPKTLRIVPWDTSMIKNIEQGIAASNLGVSTSPDSTSIRVIFPDLTTERRTLLSKLVKEKLEEAKISIRKEREKTINSITDAKKEGEISEDEQGGLKDNLQKLIDETNNKLETLASQKQTEVLES